MTATSSSRCACASAAAEVPSAARPPGYLGYALIDTVIDGFYPVLEHIGDQLAELEEEVVERPSRGTLRRIYAAKRGLLELRRAVWPHRDAIATLVRDESPFIDASTRLYLRDTADHAVQLLDVLEGYRETVSGLLDVYLSSESNRTNEVMRTLTVVASIFIPLTFIAGVYGMNFEGMPELHSRIGYPDRARHHAPHWRSGCSGSSSGSAGSASLATTAGRGMRMIRGADGSSAPRS